ncbi:ImmA/IrrE family metallo-endopeptidase [Clostridium botulinum]|uniref:ImmA/IrrE family metallo-endopeptidase n=1 Tax=Clostridium botulinum TaxID=1491 RepID=UPI002247EEF7|nr:ImmA/IrrE family metallo-endopeptidase [Clostridium botulinum]UZP03334.1 ImmA/IrrE family metallo-endopeptidase [Clostridium botulinum]UZP06692.1 ImmA/IrrE family metallo-endopeptidase [Clostridium botulinum]UZP10073.1 ImmA/IrrE family metallo-endopeptidase [Clostridium botulinum]
MNSNKIDIIDEIAEKIRVILSISEDAFDIEDVIRVLNGNIEFNPFCDSEALVVKSSKNSFTIQLSDNSNFKRMRFSIAHELGHLFLHMKYLINQEVWDDVDIGMSHARNSNLPYSVIEFEANEFAAAFLMPKNRFLEIANNTSDGSYYYPEKIASHFNVSSQSVKIRGRVLGLWE